MRNVNSLSEWGFDMKTCIVDFMTTLSGPNMDFPADPVPTDSDGLLESSSTNASTQTIDH